MLWNVNNGGGYPYPNGTDIAKYTTTANFKLMDTNGDGSITQADDPYAPYYPVSSLSSSFTVTFTAVIIIVLVVVIIVIIMLHLASSIDVQLPDAQLLVSCTAPCTDQPEVAVKR